MKRIKSVFTSDIYSSIRTNFFSLSVLQLFSMLMPLIVLPYLIRILGFELYGVTILAITIVSYFQSITDYSFKITGTRDVALNKSSKLRLEIIFSKVMLIKTFFVIISIILIILIVNLYQPFYEYKNVFFITILTLFGNYLFPDWFFQGIEKMKYITIINIVVRLIFTGLIFVFIKNKEDYLLYPLFQGLGFLIAGIIGQFILYKKYGMRVHLIKRRFLLDTIKKNFPIFVNQIFPMLYNNTSSLILGVFESNFLLGVFNAVKKVIELIVAMIGVFSRVFFPVLNVKKDLFKTYRVIISTFILISIIIIFLTRDFIFNFLDIDIEYQTELIAILLLGVVGYGLYDIYGLNYFIVKKKDKIVMKNTIVSSIIGLLLSFPFIYYFGILGAAFNLTISRLMMGGGLFIKYIKDSK